MTGEPIVDYDQDFALWAEQQAAFIAANNWTAVDARHVADAIASLSRNDRRDIKRRATLLLEVLIRIAGFPEHAERRTWDGAVDEQARRIRDLFDESPSLRQTFREHFATAHSRATKRVVTTMDDTPQSLRVMTIERWQERVEELIAEA